MIGASKPYSSNRSITTAVGTKLPKSWDARRLKTLFREVDSRTSTGQEKLLSLRMHAGLVGHHEAGGKPIDASSLVGFKHIWPGQVVMNRMRASAGLFAVADEPGLVSPDYATFNCVEPSVSARYYLELFKTPAMKTVFRAESKGLGTGDAGFLRLYTDRFGTIRVPLPPPDEQAAIVKFIDYADRRIRRYIRAKQKLIKLLEEQKQAIIHQAVTRGLDPNVRLKPSGVEWLGDVPEHWEVVPLRHLVQSKLKYGANAAAEHSNPEWPRYLRITDFRKDGTLRPDTFRSLPPEVASEYLVKPGDVLLARSGATVGKAFLVPSTSDFVACHAGYLIRARLRPQRVLPKFFFMYTQSLGFARWKSSVFIQATIHNISAEKYNSLRVPVPPGHEQESILQHLEVETREVESTIATASRQIALLREYRTRLIADVVTGKLDVREAAANLPDELDADEPEFDDTNEEGDDGDLPDEESGE